MKDVLRTDRQETFFGAVHDGGEIQPLVESPGGTIDLPPKLQVLFDILMTYTMVQFDLGYVQGMNDLLAPILLVMDSESEAFWCFTNWMEVMVRNFLSFNCH